MLKKALKSLTKIKSETCAVFTVFLALFLVVCLSGCCRTLVSNIVGPDIRENTYRNSFERKLRISDRYLSEIFGWTGFYDEIRQDLVVRLIYLDC